MKIVHSKVTEHSVYSQLKKKTVHNTREREKERDCNCVFNTDSDKMRNILDYEVKLLFMVANKRHSFRNL